MNGNAARHVRALTTFSRADGVPPLAVIGFGLLLVWFSFYTVRDLHPVWLEAVDYSHGYLVLVLTAWLFAVELRREPLAPFVPSWPGLISLFVLLLAMLAGVASTTLSVSAAVLPVFWMAAIWAASGLKNARRFVMPLAYLYVAMPIWTFLIEPLRQLTVLVVTSWIRVANLPAFIEGNLIHVPSGTFEVQGGCAGLRYAIVALALAAFSSLLNRRRWAPSASMMAFALALALVGNWVRVFITVAVGMSEGQNLLILMVRDHHTFFGWVLFAVFMLPLFYADRVLQPGGSVAKVETGATPWRFTSTYVASCALLALGIWLNHRIDRDDEPVLGTVALVAPEIPGWQRSEDWQDVRLPRYVGATAQTAGWYTDGAARVGAYVAHYPAQRQEQEAVFYENRPEGQSAVIARRKRVLTTASGATLPFQELEVADSAAERRLVWVGLRVAGRPAANALTAKVLQIRGAIAGRRDAQALVLTAVCGDDCEKARSYLSRYATAAAEPLYRQAERYPSPRLVRADSKDVLQ